MSPQTKLLLLRFAGIVVAIAIASGVASHASAGMMSAKTGDANGDGVMNSLDALTVLTYDAGMIEHPGVEGWDTAADVNCDLAVNSLDASMILQADVGLITIRP
jgi:hypothetical protein